MQRILIIEDEKPAANRLSKLIIQNFSDFSIEAIIESIEEAVLWFKSNKAPDLLFLDIQLADGISFNIFNEIQISCPVIFTTAYDQYAMKAFELNSVDYLLKPVEEEKLKNSILKFLKIKETYSEDAINNKLQNLLNEYSLQTHKYKNRFLVNAGNSLIPILIDEIAYFYAEDKAVLIKTHKNKNYIINYSIEQLSKEIDPKHFFHANRQYLLSLKCILKIHHSFNGKLKVEIHPQPNTDVIVSRLKALDFKKWLEN